jgi:glutamate synthase (ferredoxin)
VGIATQNPELRRKFQGKPEHIERYMRFVAQEVREWMARMGVRSFDELVGHVELLRQIAVDPSEKASRLNLSRLLYQTRIDPDYGLWHFANPQNHNLKREFDLLTLVPLAASAIHSGQRVEARLDIHNRNRTLGTVLSSEITRAHGEAGLPDDTIHLFLHGSGGQSFGAFLAPGVTLDLQGDCNDYLGKGQSGGRIIIRPPKDSPFDASENIIVGNVAFYGATGGEAFLNGMAGERFCVRNSGVTAVIEGVGDQGCEYMTGGVALVLGKTGRNFAAGMSGGVAYVLDEDGDFSASLNTGNVSLHPLDSEDIERVRQLLERHRDYTGSAKAQRLLEECTDQATDGFSRFVKVVPDAYAQVLAALKVAAEKQLDHDESLIYAYNAVVSSKKKAG